MDEFLPLLLDSVELDFLFGDNPSEAASNAPLYQRQLCNPLPPSYHT
jgi:hypothetical protein